MEETKHGSQPSSDEIPDTFKQHYAGTFVAKRYDKYNHSIKQQHKSSDSEWEPNPMKLESILEWVRKPENHTYVTTGCAALAVGITAIYTLFALLQWCAMLQSNQINREALESVQRAFIVCQSINQDRNRIHPPGKPKPIGIWTFFSPCENTGTTPANITAQSFSGKFLQTEPTEEDFQKTSLRIEAVVGPKAGRRVGNISKPDSFINAEVDWENPQHMTFQIKEGQPTLFFWGWVSYHDVLPNTNLHITEFCQRNIGVQVVKYPPDPVYGFGWEPCENHNCADEHCKDYEAIAKLASEASSRPVTQP
jgi:hypothetical protein